MLWNVKISIRQKLALIGIFSLTTIVVVVAIVRVTIVSTSFDTQIDQTWLYLWENVEMAVGQSNTAQQSNTANQSPAIIVSCLGSFRQLFIKHDKGRYIQPTDDQQHTKNRLLSSSRSLRSISTLHSSGRSTFRSVFSHPKQHTPSSSSGSVERIAPLDNISESWH